MKVIKHSLPPNVRGGGGFLMLIVSVLILGIIICGIVGVGVVHVFRLKGKVWKRNLISVELGVTITLTKFMAHIVKQPTGVWCASSVFHRSSSCSIRCFRFVKSQEIFPSPRSQERALFYYMAEWTRSDLVTISFLRYYSCHEKETYSTIHTLWSSQYRKEVAKEMGVKEDI